MIITKRLHQLQELDKTLGLNLKALKEATGQIGDNREVERVKAGLASRLERFGELQKEQHTAEWQIDDLKAKIAVAEESLYSGRIANPKELSGLQQDASSLKTRCGHLEDKTLELMEQVEKAQVDVDSFKARLETLEARWYKEQEGLTLEVERLKAVISELESGRKLLLNDIDTAAVAVYEDLRKKRGQAVARVEQGVCGGCGISLSVSELQLARSGSLVQCSSCGRILYLA